MKIAIHNRKTGFSQRFIRYCQNHEIDYKLISCYDNNIIEQVRECDAVLWHFHQGSPKDILFAKQFIYSLQIAGIRVFPDFHTAWHFNDKVGQKYLLEGIGAPLVPTWIFYDKSEAIKWIEETDFPKVFKLRGGAGSNNVRLMRTKDEAAKLIRKAFGRGFPSYDALASLKERWRMYKSGKTNIQDLVEGMVRFVIPPKFSKVGGRERGYIYIQKFISKNDHDIRIVVIGDKAFAIKRMVRENDFRASGSGEILYDHSLFDEATVKLAFNLAEKLMSQCVAFDFIYDEKKPFVTELSYGFTPEPYDLCPGYWDKNLNWHVGKFDPYGWIIDNLVNQISKKN
jgi:glutathione synthase/RimK-type ligase-like ATP-grasp enzyme